MLSVKLLRSLVLGDTINTNTLFSNDNTTSSGRAKSKTTPLLIFLPTNELIENTHRLCTIARDIGMNLHPTPSLSHIIFSWPSPFSDNSVPLPFPSLTYTSTTHLQCFVNLSRGYFKLVFIKRANSVIENINYWDCCSVSLFCRVGGGRISSMDGFCGVLVGRGWSMFKTKGTPSLVCGVFISVFLFRKIDSTRVEFARLDEGFRIRELRVPSLDFGNAPLRILQYIVLVTDDVFFLA